MPSKKTLRGGLGILLLTAAITLNPFTVQLANADDSASATIRSIATGEAVVTDLRGRAYKVGENITAVGASSIENIIPANPSTAGSSLTPGIDEATMSDAVMYTDNEGLIHKITNTTLGDLADGTGTDQIMDTGTSRFAPNRICGDFMTDTTGKLYRRDSNGKIWRVLNGTNGQATTKPSSMFYGDSLSYTGHKGKIWVVRNASSSSGDIQASSATDRVPEGVTLTADQAVESDQFLYADTSGNLYDRNGTFIIGNMTPGIMLPDTLQNQTTPIVFTDKNGIPYLRTASKKTVRINLDNSATLNPNMYYMAETNVTSQPAVLIVDSQGTLHLATSNGKAKTVSTVVFPPNQIAITNMPPGGSDTNNSRKAILAAADGTVYQLRTSSSTDSGISLNVTGLYVKPSGSETLVTQMPTTGAPEGVSTIGLLAVVISLAGAVLMLTRRHN